MPGGIRVTVQDQVNRRTWAGPWIVEGFAKNRGFVDEGERAAYRRVAETVGSGRILDLGVGGGRTIELLRELGDRYTAIDYLPAMVESVRRQYPSVDVRLGDARNLSAFADATFRLVAFSNRGIDAVSHEDRRCILAEAYRVLEPGGIFWFSTLNKDGEVPRLRPWSPRLPWLRPGVPRRFGHLLRTLRSMPRGTLNYYRSSSARAEGDGWLTAPFYAHNFGLIVHYTTLGSQIAELQQAGFRGSVEVYDDESGARIRAGEQLGRVPSFDILASK